MFGRGVYGVLAVFMVLLFVSSMFSPVTSGFVVKKRTIKVAIIRQYWDLLDVRIGNKSTIDHKKCLRDAESRYGVKFKVYEFWDGWDGGDVQNGRLEKLGIDVVIAPGGFGGLCTPKKYRKELKQFVKKGGGFYGICGDSTFGSLGLKNPPRKSDYFMAKVLGYDKFTPTLGLANVYTDGSAFDGMVGNLNFLVKFDAMKFLMQLAFSRAPIYFPSVDPPIQEHYFGKTVNVMLGNAPLVKGHRLFMPKVAGIAFLNGSDKPYGDGIGGKMVIVATTYGKGRVVLSAVHPEHTVGNEEAHDVYERDVLWLARALPDT